MTPPHKPSPDDEAGTRILETARELQALIASAPPPEPGWEVFGEAVARVNEEVHEAEASLLTELLDLVLPDLKRHATWLRSVIEEEESTPDTPLGEDLRGWVGTIGARTRQAEWLKEPGIRLFWQLNTSGFFQARPEDAGAVTSHGLYALADGRLARIDMVGTWKVVERYAQYQRQLADARLISPREAVELFPLHQMFSALHRALWDPPLARDNNRPRGPNLEARRERFNALITEWAEATRAHGFRLRRVGDNPP
jgi:hypothetical protein